MKVYLNKVFILLIVLFSLTSLYAKDNSGLQVMYISLDPAPLKEKASAVSREIGSVDYATPVYILEEKKTWIFITPINDDSVTGWIPSTSVTKKKLKPNDVSATADAEEIALAGKGFTSALEACYAEAYDLDYSDINYMETLSVDDMYEILIFADEGNLYLGGEE